MLTPHFCHYKFAFYGLQTRLWELTTRGKRAGLQARDECLEIAEL
jgi:hypothetical protein